MFFWNSHFFDDPAAVGNLISGSSALSKTSLNIWKFTVHVLPKPGLEIFHHYFTSMWDECNCAVVWAFFDTVFLWDWDENWPFPVLWPLLSFPNFSTFTSLTVWITINCGKFWKRWEYQITWPAFWETYMQVRKQQLEQDMEQQTGSE